MNNTEATNWIRAGLFALPVYGLLTIWTTIGARPDAAVDPEGWARFVSSTSYLAGHVIGSALGTMLAIFGTFALGAHLARPCFFHPVGVSPSDSRQWGRHT